MDQGSYFIPKGDPVLQFKDGLPRHTDTFMEALKPLQSRRKFNVRPTEMPGRKWHLIAVWDQYDAIGETTEKDIWISGEVDEFVREYRSGERDFGKFSIADGAKVSVNNTPIAEAMIGAVPHVPERCTVADSNSGDIDVWVTAGYGPVPSGRESALLARQNPPGQPNVTVQFWAPYAVEESLRV